MSGYDVDMFVRTPDPEFLCPICCTVLHQPVESPCRHVFCRACIEKWLNGEGENRSNCPTCREPTSVDSLRPVLPLIQNMINRLPMKCPYEMNGCSVGKILLENYQSHSKSCDYEEVMCGWTRCGETFFRRVLASHEAICDYREVRCERGCTLLILESEMPGHCCLQALRQRNKEQEEKLARHREREKSLMDERNELQRELQIAQVRLMEARAADRESVFDEYDGDNDEDDDNDSVYRLAEMSSADNAAPDAQEYDYFSVDGENNGNLIQFDVQSASPDFLPAGPPREMHAWPHFDAGFPPMLMSGLPLIRAVEDVEEAPTSSIAPYIPLNSPHHNPDSRPSSPILSSHYISSDGDNEDDEDRDRQENEGSQEAWGSPDDHSYSAHSEHFYFSGSQSEACSDDDGNDDNKPVYVNDSDSASQSFSSSSTRTHSDLSSHSSSFSSSSGARSDSDASCSQSEAKEIGQSDVPEYDSCSEVDSEADGDAKSDSVVSSPGANTNRLTSSYDSRVPSYTPLSSQQPESDLAVAERPANTNRPELKRRGEAMEGPQSGKRPCVRTSAAPTGHPFTISPATTSLSTLTSSSLSHPISYARIQGQGLQVSINLNVDMLSEIVRGGNGNPPPARPPRPHTPRAPAATTVTSYTGREESDEEDMR